MERVRLEEFNQWWATGKVDADLALPFKRDAYYEVEEGLGNRFIMAVTGLRRVGKTTIMYQLIQSLLAKKIPPTDILFFSFDEKMAGLSEVLDFYREFQNKDFRTFRAYIFLDEIQKCDNWENELKKYYDLYPKAKFIISGSESLFIKKRTKETLAGRIFEFAIGTFAFREYLEFNGVGEDQLRYETVVKPHLRKFIERGGFPETFAMESDREFKEYVRALVVDRIVYKDIPKIFKIEDPEFLKVLLEIIATNPGMYVDYQSLSQQFGKDRRVIKDYVSYLKEGFLIRMLGNYRKGSATTLRKKKRAYPTDNAITYLYMHGIDDAFFGRMVETAAICRMNADTFWKDVGEIDIVHNGIPIEVKYQESISPEDFRSLREFMKKFGKKEGIMITKANEGMSKFQEGTVKLIPMHLFLLNGAG
jgi:hypothetical protein